MTLLDWIVLASLGLSPFPGVPRKALTRAPLEQMASKLYPRLPSDLAALIRF